MVCFQTKNPNLGKFLRVLQWKMTVIFYGHLVHFTVFCFILWTFGIVRGNLVYFPPFRYFEPRKIWQPCWVWRRNLAPWVLSLFGAEIGRFRTVAKLKREGVKKSFKRRKKVFLSFSSCFFISAEKILGVETFFFSSHLMAWILCNSQKGSYLQRESGLKINEEEGSQFICMYISGRF
jgi:hypothetical protein